MTDEPTSPNLLAVDGAFGPPVDDRWQQLIHAFDPERNMRAVADLLQQAAAGSQQVLSSITPSGGSEGDGDTPGASLLRDAMAEMERSFARVYDIAGSFMTERPFRAAGGPGHASSIAEIVVMDGVGTTVIELPGAPAVPHAGSLHCHNGDVIPSESVRIVQAKSYGSDAETFVVRVDAGPDAGPGLYHGHVLVEGLPHVALPLTVHVIDDE